MGRVPLRCRRFAPCSGTGAPARAARGRVDPLADLPVDSVARSRRRRSSSSTSAAMKIVHAAGTSSCTLQRTLELELEHTDASPAGDPVDLGAQRPVPAPGDVRDPLEELVAVDPCGELLVGQEPVVVPVDLARALRARRRRDGDLELGHALDSPLMRVPFPAPDGPVTTKTGRTARRPARPLTGG